MWRVDSLEKTESGRYWGQEEKGTTKDEMAGWHHWLDGCESEWTPGVGDGQGGLVCCDSRGSKESDTTEPLKWSELTFSSSHLSSHLILKTIVMIRFYQKRTQRPGGLVSLCKVKQILRGPASFLWPLIWVLVQLRTLDLKYLDSNSGFTSCLTLGMISNLSTPVSPKQGIVIETVNQRAVLKVKWVNT